MSTAEITKRLPGGSPRVASNFVGAYYLLTVVTGTFVLLFHGRFAFAVDLLVGIFYLVVTAFLYGLSASANRKR
ncbi:MAG TPA: hypothetical protein VMU05_13200 [Dongiaceae bacterium]|nr:hypothetical protein [Dongiaceae bacterium]